MELFDIGMYTLGGSTLLGVISLGVSNFLFSRRPKVYGNTLPVDFGTEDNSNTERV